MSGLGSGLGKGSGRELPGVRLEESGQRSGETGMAEPDNGGGAFPDLDVFRRRLARRQRADHGPAHPRRLARLDGIRRRPRVRRGCARPRSPLCPGEPVRGELLPQPAGIGRHLARARGRRPETLRSRCRALYPADVLGGDRVAGRHPPRPGINALVPLYLRGADTEAKRRRDHAVPVPAADGGMRAGRCQGRMPLSQQHASTPTTPAPSSRPRRAASTIA